MGIALLSIVLFVREPQDSHEAILGLWSGTSPWKEIYRKGTLGKHFDRHLEEAMVHLHPHGEWEGWMLQLFGTSRQHHAHQFNGCILWFVFEGKAYGNGLERRRRKMTMGIR